MKKITTVFAAALLFVACQKEEKKGNLTITGDVHGLSKGTLYIKQKKDTSLVVLDSIQIAGDSKFSTVIDIAEPEMLYLFLDRGTTNSIDNSLAFFAEPGKMNIDTNLETFYAKAKITGSKNQELYDKFKVIKSRFVGQELEITAKDLEAFKNKTTLPAEDKAKYDALIRRRYLYTINFIMTNKDKEIAPYLAIVEIPDAGLKFMDTINKSLTPKIAKSKYGKIFGEYVAERHKTEDTAANSSK
ncbi:DUF4369 domain-containing protein [Flavobacterium silvaticum]|uniref:DUF4369 domain-containing protein n=1 Tax=Flavobacterium silvaticum TaxID=1852020 RepID=A0A972FNT8_9FLAO|nr:DUF4369 domain-containing protein [Flavobacterium silvaticum]NMH29446.1 DUF4369 domain-containing protein [Flavobacterium silvaticum]